MTHKSHKFIVLFAVLVFLGASFIPSPEAFKENNPVLYSVYKGLEEFGVVDAWKMGCTGEGVNVAVMDSGVDFGAPDLIGTQARVKNKNSPYFGWPIVVDLYSLSQYQERGFGGHSQYADTSSTDPEGYELSGTSMSGVYHIGNHPDRNLTKYYGKVVKILLVDEKQSGVYDTVYVDLNNNRDFRDDKPCRQGDEISYWDRNRDGLPDESGGMVYFIADGKTPLPFSRILYGKKAKIPANGEMVAFHFDPYSHGTMCAGTIAARGKNVWGLAPGAKIIPVSSMGGNEMTRCILASLGYDGKANTGDEANIISRSAGFTNFNKGADENSVFLEYLTTKVFPSTMYVYAGGNAGSGYGTCGSPASEHVIKVGAIMDLWWKKSPHRGDIICFSSRGPNVLGHVKPNVLATGFFAPQVRPLWSTHYGRSAWDMYGGGTSNAAPHVAGVMALIYQAYKEAHGEFPQSGTARDILMCSATDINEEVFAQGSGIINAKRAVEIASGRNAALIQPALFTTQPVEAGSTLEFHFTLSNYSGKPVSLRPLKLFKKDKKSFTIKADDDKLLVPIEKEFLTGDLVRVSSYSAKDSEKRPLEDTVGYILHLYNWKDLNHDGKYGPSPSIPLEEAQEEELKPINIADWDHVITSEVRIHDPQERVDDGLVLELKKECEVMKRHVKMKSRDVTIVVETFEWRKWDGFHVIQDKDKIKCRVLTPEETGIYQGKVLLEIEGADKKQCIPISFATYKKDEIKAVNTSEIYENTKLYSRFEGSGRMGYRDARFYPLFHQGNDTVTVNVSWEDPGTDIDITLYGKGSLGTSKLWDYSTKPPIEFPVLPVLEDNGHSTRRTREIPCSALVLATEKTITGILKEGLNILVLNMANNDGNLYGENIDIKIKPFAPMMERSVDLKGDAGETVRYESEEIDCIVGFGERESIQYEDHTFKAKKGDIVLLRPNGPYYYSTLYRDKNGNGKIDKYKDNILLKETQRRLARSFSDDVIPLPWDGTYILTDFTGEFYHLKGRYEKRDGHIPIETPQKAGAYTGIAKKGENFLPVFVNLNVEPIEAVCIEIEMQKPVRDKKPFEVKLKVCDRFGNLVKEEAAVTVEFEGVTQKVDIKNGEGKATLTAPKQEGKYGIKVNSPYGIKSDNIDITRGPVVEIGELTSQKNSIAVKLHNWGESDTEVNIYANPSSYILPKMASRRGMSNYSFFYDKGYKNGYVPFSAKEKVSLSGGEEKEIVLQIPALKDSGRLASSVPYIVAVMDTDLNVITHRETFPFQIRRSGIEIDPKKEKNLEEIQKVFIGEPISFKAEGLVILRMNDIQPLFFLPTLSGILSIKPDVSGKLMVKTQERSHVIKVVEKEAGEGKKEAGQVKPDKTPPAKIKSVVIQSRNGSIQISWRPTGDKDIDHYKVYRLRGSRLKKVKEVKTPEYTMEAKLWNTYTFRIAAVDKAGNEGELSDPYGIVATPSHIL